MKFRISFFSAVSSRHTRARRAGLAPCFVCLGLVAAFTPARAVDEMPALPVQFDSATVQSLVQRIDEGRNASILKAVYFNPHMKQALPQADGFKLLKAAVQKEPQASKRWFYLQSTYAFAALRLGAGKPDEGVEAYDVFFDHAKRAIGAGTYYPVQRAVYEFVYTAPSQLVMTSPTDMGVAGGTLYKAFDSYLQLLRVKQEGPFEPDWERVVSFSAFDQRYERAIDAALKDPAMPKSLAFYKMSAAFSKYSDPDRNIKSLQEAKALLPPMSAPGAAVQARELYEMLVDAALVKRDLPLALATQQELIERTGRGRARLAMLYLQNDKGKEFNAVVSELEKPVADETDINDFAVMLLNWGMKDAKRLPRLQREAEALLKKYLSDPRTRSNDQELIARLTLAQNYIDQKRLADARAVLAAAKLEPGAASSDAPMLYDVVQRMSQRLDGRAVSIVKPAVPKAKVSTAGVVIPKARARPSQTRPAGIQPGTRKPGIGKKSSSPTAKRHEKDPV